MNLDKIYYAAGWWKRQAAKWYTTSISWSTSMPRDKKGENSIAIHYGSHELTSRKN